MGISQSLRAATPPPMTVAGTVVALGAPGHPGGRARDSRRRRSAGRVGGMRSHRFGAKLTLGALSLLLLAAPAQASLFQGETLDTVANVLSWVVLVVAPAVGIAVFWIVHILPEKIAERNNHPQAKAIQTLCLLSLFFGGLLWPLAWLWAYSKPVLHKIAYGTDKAEHPKEEPRSAAPDDGRAAEIERLRGRIAELESGQKSRPAAGGGSA